jgi:hypothetical protein
MLASMARQSFAAHLLALSGKLIEVELSTGRLIVGKLKGIEADTILLVPEGMKFDDAHIIDMGHIICMRKIAD